MNWLGKLPLKNQILLWFVFIAVLPLVINFLTNYFLQKDEFEKQAAIQLQVVLNEKIALIEKQVKYLESDIKLISSAPYINRSFKDADAFFTLHQKTALPAQEFDRTIKVFLDKNQYYDLFFINQNADIIYSYRKDVDLGNNLLDKRFQENNLSLAYKKAAMLLESNISSFAYYPPSNDYAAFIAHPIFFEGEALGVIAIEFHQKSIFEIFSNTQGLGASGELLAGMLTQKNTAIAMTPLRYVENSVDTVFEYPVFADLSMNKAVKGSNGTGISTDYRGIKSISAWGYIPALNWGIVAKIDKSEVLKPLNTLEFYSVLILLFVLLGITIAIMFATKHLVRPIKILSRQVKKFTKGDFDLSKTGKADVSTRNEIDILTYDFNEMAHTIKTSQDTIRQHSLELEDKVMQRTEELKEKNVTLNRYLKIIDSYVITSTVDIEGKIEAVSQAFCDLTGYSKEELLGKSYKETGRYQISDETYQENFKTLNQKKSWTGELKKQKKDGSTYWVHLSVLPSEDKSGKTIGYTTIYQDITLQKLSEEMSITDALTGVFNRRHFDNLLPKMVANAQRQNDLFCFLMLDIDHFKLYNDNYGHQMGDIALQEFAKTLRNALGRLDDIPFRLGGEEFGVIFKAESQEQAIVFANKIIENIAAMKLTHEFSLVSPYITASAGLFCKLAKEITTTEELYQQTDRLLYQAKSSGRNRVVANDS